MPKSLTVEELEPFHVYVTCPSRIGTKMESYGSTFIYLGKSRKTKLFVWLYIGSLQQITCKNDIYKLANNYALEPGIEPFKVTKNIKQVYKMVRYAKYNNFVFDINNWSLSAEAKMFIEAYLEV